MRMEKQSFFALTAWRLGGACVRRAAMTLAVMLMTVTAWATTVETYYIDADGVRYDVTATVLTSVVPSNYNPIVLTPNQWYVVNSDADISSTVSQIFADVGDGDNYNLILADGKTLTFESSNADGAIRISSGILNIYGQTSSTGKLVVSAKGSSGNAIYARHGINIVGGIVEASSTGGSGIHSSGNVTISGGQVSATGGGSHEGISSLNGIKLGWRQATDRIYASSYNRAVTIADGQAFLTDDDPPVQVSGTVKYDYISISTAIDGKTLRPDLTPEFAETATDEYTIKTAKGWDVFCDALQDNDTWNRFSGKTVKLGANITVSRMAGGNNHEFTGTFDGDGHTLTLAYGTADAPVDAQFVAPFVATSADGSNQPVFRNLTIDGTIYDSYSGSEAHNVGGLIGHLYGDVTIEHCTSNLTITSVGGAGGFVGLCEHTAMFTDCVSSAVITSPGGNNSGFVSWSRASGHAISFEGCVFNGKLLQQNGEGSLNGGFIGWTGSNKTVTITNCLCNPAATTSGEKMATSNSATFARGWNATTTAPNSYYTTAFSTVQGEQARSITAGGNVTTNGTYLESEAVTIDHAGVPTAYTTSGITAYKATENSSTFIAGILYNEVLYAGNGDEVSLTLSNTPPDGYGFDSYTTLPKSTTLTEDGDNYTLTIPNENVRIMAMFAPLPITVRYIDERGVEQTVDALDLSKFDGVIPNGSVCSFSSEDLANVNFRIGGDVTIILLDDFELRIENIDGNHTITFYGQEKGNGKLYVTKSIYNNVTVYAGSITVGVDEESEGNVYGTVTVHGGSLTNRGNVIGNSVNSVTVDGGSFTNGGYVNSAVTVSGGSFTNGGDVNGNVTVDGGNVHIDGTIYNVEELSWTKPSDSFYAAKIYGIVAIVDGKIFYDEDGKHYSGIIALDDETETNPIDGKTLRPFMNITLADNDDNSSAISNWNGGMADVTLNDRTLYKDGMWNTLCLPFDVTVGRGQMEDATAMTFDGETSGFVASTGVLTLNFVGVDGGRTITAGTPFIVKWSKSEGYDANPTDYDVTNPVFSGVTVSNTEAGSVTSTDKKVQFVGTYSPVVIYSDAHDNLYLGAANTLYWPSTENFTLGACRAYFHVDSEVQSKVRAFVLNFGEDEATGILSTTDDADFTDSVDAWYDLSGRKLSGKPSQRGVYIHGGRKVAIQ